MKLMAEEKASMRKEERVGRPDGVGIPFTA